jgi:hypothetical protein
MYNDAFRHADVKRFLTEFAKGARNPALVADLLVSDLEYSLQTFDEIGDYEPIVDHLYAILNLLDKRLREIDVDARGPLVARLNDLADKWGASFGYGISDELVDFAECWKERI